MNARTPRTAGPTASASAVAALLAVPAAGAQPGPAPLQFTTVNVNYVYAASLGFGGYSIAGLSASVYTLQLSTTLDNLPLDGWKLGLLLPAQLGI